MNNENQPTEVEPEKPLPIGVITEAIWKQQRMKELSRAIGEYLDCASPDYKLIRKWTRELHGLVDGASGPKEAYVSGIQLCGSSENSVHGGPRKPSGGVGAAAMAALREPMDSRY